jgi:hypothetical protein
MNKTIHITRADLVREPEQRQLLPNPGRDAELHISAKRRPDLEEADETDTFVFNGLRYKMRWKRAGAESDSAIEFGLLHIGRMDD